MHRIGFACSPNAAVPLDATWDSGASAPIPLTAVSQDKRSSTLLPGMLLGALDLDLDTIAGGATTIQAMLTWDAAGTKVVAAPCVVALGVGLGVVGTALAVTAPLVSLWPPPSPSPEWHRARC
jgi:hypothetical protein